MDNKLKTRSFTLRLPQDTFNQLDQIAAREGFYPSAIVRHLVMRFVENRQSLEGFYAHFNR